MPLQLENGNGIRVAIGKGKIDAWKETDVKEVSIKDSVNAIAEKIERATGVTAERITLAGAGGAFDACVWERLGDKQGEQWGTLRSLRSA